MSSLAYSGEYANEDFMASFCSTLPEPANGTILQVKMSDEEMEAARFHILTCTKRYWSNQRDPPMDGWDGAEVWDLDLLAYKQCQLVAVPSIHTVLPRSTHKRPTPYETVAAYSLRISQGDRVATTAVRTRGCSWMLIFGDMRITDILTCQITVA